MFKTRYCEHDRFHCDSGSRFEPEYATHFDENGELIFEVVGQIDLYDRIQSHADSVDVNLILRRYSNGEIDALDRYKGFYADVSDLPDNYAELLNRINEAERFFNSLPAEEKDRFGNSFSVFLSQLDTNISHYVNDGKKNAKVDSVSSAVNSGSDKGSISEPA